MSNTLPERLKEGAKRFLQGKNAYLTQYHLRQYQEVYRSTLAFIDFLKRSIPWQKEMRILDIGCGGGANIYWFRQKFPHWHLEGLDVDAELLEFARFMNPNVPFHHLDVAHVDRIFPPKAFDYVLAIQFVNFADNLDLETFLKSTLYLAKYGIAHFSLFSEGWIEQYTYAYDYEEEIFAYPYLIYSIERMKVLVKKYHHEPFHIQYEPFEIDLDLPKPSKPKFRTYTIRTEDGHRLQVSGYMIMPWYSILIDLSP